MHTSNGPATLPSISRIELSVNTRKSEKCGPDRVTLVSVRLVEIQNPSQPPYQPAEPPLGGKSWTPKMLETSSITPKDDFSSHIAIISVTCRVNRSNDRRSSTTKLTSRQSDINQRGWQNPSKMHTTKQKNTHQNPG